MRPEDEFESRLNDDHWDDLISRKVLVRIERKERNKKIIISSLVILASFGLGVSYMNFENILNSPYEVISQMFNPDPFVLEMDEMIGFLENF